jgi:hypothetical protein
LPASSAFFLSLHTIVFRDTRDAACTAFECGSKSFPGPSLDQCSGFLQCGCCLPCRFCWQCC